jgi:hypothetical protein
MNSTYEDSQLRITHLWPDTHLPHPQVPAPPYRISEDALLEPVPSGRRGIPTTVLERSRGFRNRAGVLAVGEIYAELAELDVDEPAAVLTFANRWGVLGISANDFALVRSVPGFVKPDRQLDLGIADAGDVDAVPVVETLEEFRLGARYIRELLATYRKLSDDEAGESGDPESEWSVDDFARVLTSGLSPFHPHVFAPLTLGVVFHPTRVPDWTSGVNVPLYAVCCLELYNHIVENATLRRCANDNCRRTFVRQTGRAQQGQYRSEGIKYCSKHCARATAQRRHRARRRASRATDSTG